MKQIRNVCVTLGDTVVPVRVATRVDALASLCRVGSGEDATDRNVEVLSIDGDHAVLSVDGRRYRIDLAALRRDELRASDAQGRRFEVKSRVRCAGSLRLKSHRRPEPVAPSASVSSPITGEVMGVHVSAGQHVQVDAPLVTIEAMKMEIVIRATHERVVREVAVAAGTKVMKGAQLVTFEDASEARV